MSNDKRQMMVEVDILRLWSGLRPGPDPPQHRGTAGIPMVATGFTQETHAEVVAAMPKGQAKQEVSLFRLDFYTFGEDMEREFAERGLKPVGPFSSARHNPVFTKHPNGTQFKDARSEWSIGIFNWWCGARGIFVWLYGDDVDDGWWFAGEEK